jgi:HEAT repeat protein
MAGRLMDGEPVHTVVDTADAAAWTALDIGIRERAQPQPTLLPSRARIDGRRIAWDRNEGLKVMRRGHAPLSENELVLALCHLDGRIREAVIDRVAHFPELLPLVVIRCADWAAPVRERARTLLADALPRVSGPDLVTLAALVLRVARRGQGAFARDLLDRTLRQGMRENIEALLASEDRATRRFAHRLAVQERLLSPARLARAASGDDDVVIQDVCAEAAIAAVRDCAYDEVLGPLLGSHQPRVRSAGVTALRRAGRPAQAQPFLADRSGLVRACARWVLRQHGTDPLPLYRALCADPSARDLPPAAPLGLAECGSRTDAVLLVPLLGHPSGAVRAGAVAGLRVLDRADAELLLPLLDDPSPSAAREAATALLPSADRLPEAWLTLRLSTDRPVHTRKAAFRLLRAQGGVAQLRAAVQLLTDEDPGLKALAGPAIQLWVVPPAGVPRGDAEVAALLDRCTHLFSDYVLARLRRELGITG